jgi:hypothetical protein
MFCVIQELQLKKFNDMGAYKRLEVITNPFNTSKHPQYGHWETGERYHRSNRTAYKISVHENKRINGVVTKKQFVVTTVNYYMIAEGWLLLGEYHDKISAIAEKLNVDDSSVYTVIEAKTKPLEERIKAEFATTEEYRFAAERKNTINVYKKEKADFALRYGCDEKLYDFCFNVFGELMNRGYYEEITSNHKTLEAIKNNDWGLNDAKKS